MFNSNHVKFCFVGIVLLASSGCASLEGFPKRSENVEGILDTINTTYSTTAVITAYTKKSNAEKQAYRNEVIAARMMAIDMRFAEFQKTMFSQRATLLVGGDATTSLLSSAGALTTAGQTSQILSGLTGAFTAANGSVNTNIYQGNTQIAIISMMLAERASVRARISERMGANIASYPLTMALSDLEDYYNAGSIPGALATITATAGEKQIEAENRMVNTIKIENQSVERSDISQALGDVIKTLKPTIALEILKLRLPGVPEKVRTDALNQAGVSQISDIPERRAISILEFTIEQLVEQDGVGDQIMDWDKLIRDKAKAG